MPSTFVGFSAMLAARPHQEICSTVPLEIDRQREHIGGMHTASSRSHPKESVMQSCLSFYINGGWVAPSAPQPLDVINPANRAHRLVSYTVY